MARRALVPGDLNRTLSDVWSIPRAEESQICVQGNLESDKKEFSVSRICHVHFSSIELVDKHADELTVAIGLKSSKRIRSPPIVFPSQVHSLNLTFSFTYYHQLKVRSLKQATPIYNTKRTHRDQASPTPSE